METAEILVEAITPLDLKTVKSLSDFSLKRVFWLLIVVAVMFLIIGILFIFIDAVPIGIGLILFAVLFPILMLVVNRASTKKNNELIINKGLSQFFRFSADSLYIETGKADMMQSSGNYTYDMLYKAFEITDYFFIYINKVNAVIINKSSFIKGAPDDLRALLSSKFGNKFKQK